MASAHSARNLSGALFDALPRRMDVLARSNAVTTYDFLLKTDVDTLICFSMVTDMLDAVRHRFGTDESIYLGHIETCSKIAHFALDRFYDPVRTPPHTRPQLRLAAASTVPFRECASVASLAHSAPVHGSHLCGVSCARLV
jgi:hypothetical protein